MSDERWQGFLACQDKLSITIDCEECSQRFVKVKDGVVSHHREVPWDKRPLKSIGECPYGGTRLW